MAEKYDELRRRFGLDAATAETARAEASQAAEDPQLQAEITRLRERMRAMGVEADEDRLRRLAAERLGRPSS